MDWSRLEWPGVGWSGLEWPGVAWSGLERNSIKPNDVYLFAKVSAFSRK